MCGCGVCARDSFVRSGNMPVKGRDKETSMSEKRVYRGEDERVI
jgi:hypothetical protein